MSNVKLAVRVRPFTDKEIRSEKDRTQVVSVLNENTITITNVKVSASGAGDSRERVRRYNADFTFDSACAHSQPTYASQEKVFNTIGQQVLASIAQGSPACVLAYGQSATGKTHTMMGTETQPGLIPRICRALAEQQPCEVTVSFLEIYNEKVHDLLVGEAANLTCHSLPRRKGNVRKDLRVREHPARGPYVQNLRRVAVRDVEALLTVVYEGARCRRTAATRRNSTSSRSHALLELATPRATLHLADLAGSEKASWEGCGGGRQKEGANINKSLVALSNVISALVRGGRRYVPYRDSALTWLLKDCFTGGAPTFIIATVSPSISCYGESASTLRWAERARQLPVQRGSNTTSSVSRAALQAQFNQLLAELATQYIRYVPETGKIIYDDSHWTFINKANSGKQTEENTDSKIGNIMSITYPKTDTHNSESTPSSVASGSSDIINTMDKTVDISNEISKEVDKLFGPTLERTLSGSDLQIIAPEKNTRRQYKSQEVLPIDKTLQLGQSSRLSDVSQSLSEVNLDEAQSTDDDKITPVPVVYDTNQRADIVASVTERLYSKLKKKDAPAVKVDSGVDKKVTQPLNELRICTNARQRLVELSQKALRNKRRIGIPVHTQTRKNVIRVKDQEIDVQNDLESYVINKKRSFLLYRDASTETTPMTPRYKEIAVGPSYGSWHVRDKSTITENKKVPRKNSFMMTDIVKKADHSTQTPVIQPIRRKKRSSIFSKLIKKIENSRNNVHGESSVSPIININISPTYPDNSESSDDDKNKKRSVKKNMNTGKATLTPDLLTNHSSTDKKDKKNKVESTSSLEKTVDDTDESILFIDDRDAHCVNPSQLVTKPCDDFSEPEDNVLPRVVVSPSPLDPSEIKDMILGRSANSYPYNIVLSPSKPRDDTRKIIRFKEIDITPAECCKLNWDDDDIDLGHGKRDWISYDNTRESLYSDCSSSSKLESDTFSWRKGRPTNQSTNTSNSLKRNYLAVPKSNVKYKIARAKVYKEFLGLENDLDHENNCRKCSPPKLEFNTSDNTDEYILGSQDLFRQRRQFFENKFSRGFYPQRDTFSNIERKIINSCNKLELTADRYKHYLNDYKENKFAQDKKDMRTRTPTEYLQHLVQLRKQVIQANSHKNESFV
ncbi:uncharacterized protein [Epargyreus clarus]|uniref:uncharacterized protein n=1 Tax=Epargyreus clarus TaxID=520877 RepID=UPI003C2F9DD4